MSEKPVETRRRIMMQRLQEKGACDFNNRELVELLMIYSSGKNNTEEVTGELFDFFGSMSEILEAPVSELTHFKGISSSTALLFSMIPQLSRKMLVCKDFQTDMQRIDAVRAFIPNFFIGISRENFLLLCLDKSLNLIKWEMVSEGSVNSSALDLRKLIQIVMECDAKNVIIAHNHPRGTPFPSDNDKRTTEIIARSLRSINVELLDHIIVSSCGSFSFSLAGVINCY